MRTLYFRLTLVLLTAVFWQSLRGQTKPANDNIYFISLNQAIQEGQWDGLATVKELKEHGDFGLGSEEMLASELVLLDGKAYGIPWNGKAFVMDEKTKIAYAAVKYFKPDTTLRIQKEMSVEELQEALKLIINKNAFAAVRIRTRLESVQYRSFKKHSPPYTDTKRAEADTIVKNELEATIVGFYTPGSAAVLNSPVFHFHMLDAAKSTGGHLLKGQLRYAEVQVDFAQGLQVLLPDPSMMKNVDLTKEPGK